MSTHFYMIVKWVEAGRNGISPRDKNKQSGLAFSPTPAQDRHMLNFDESQIQVFCELRGKLKENSFAIKVLEIARRIGPRKGGRG